MAQRIESDLDLGAAARITNLPAPAADNDAARRVDLGKIGAAKSALFTGAAQTLTDTYTDVTGSSITITPSANPSNLVYEFSVMFSYAGSGQPIGHFKLFRDGVEITSARTTLVGFTVGDGYRAHFRFSVANASLSATTFKLQARRFSSSFPAKLHETTLWDGALSSQASSATASVLEILP